MELHRFERLIFLLDMLKAGFVALFHPSQWPDPNESSFLTSGRVQKGVMVQGPDGIFRGSLPRHVNSVAADLKFASPMGRFVFAQCFTTSEETERLWLAARTDARVRWSVDATKYLTAAKKAAGKHMLSLLKVDYRRQPTVEAIHRQYADKYGRAFSMQHFDSWASDVLIPLSTKRDNFSDEHEHRLVLISTDLVHASKDQNHPPALSLFQEKERVTLNLPLVELVTNVLLPPDTTGTEVAIIEAQLRNTGHEGAVTRSLLYEAPDFDEVVSEKPISKA